MVAGFWMWLVADAQTRPNPIFVKVIATLSILFFGLCTIYGCLKLRDKRPGLTIDDQGIVDHSSGVAVGRIPWSDVVGMNVTNIAGQRMITVLVVDPQKYIDSCSSFARMANASNTKMTGSPINISPSTLKVDFNELLRLLTEAYEKHKRMA